MVALLRVAVPPPGNGVIMVTFPPPPLPFLCRGVAVVAKAFVAEIVADRPFVLTMTRGRVLQWAALAEVLEAKRPLASSSPVSELSEAETGLPRFSVGEVMTATLVCVTYTGMAAVEVIEVETEEGGTEAEEAALATEGSTSGSAVCPVPPVLLEAAEEEEAVEEAARLVG